MRPDDTGPDVPSAEGVDTTAPGSEPAGVAAGLPQPPASAEPASPADALAGAARRPRHRRRHIRRPGELTPGWGTVFGTAWLLVAVGFASVWVSSRTTGLSTWWLGPETAPRFILIWFVPFVAPLLLAASGYSQVRRLPIAGVVGAAVTALVAVGDLGRVNGYAAVEFTLAAGGLLVSIASVGGVYRVAGGAAAGADDGGAAPTSATDG